MGPEAKLYQKLRKNSKGITWNRIENLSSLGTPDLLGYNANGHFFTVELKVTKGKKLKFSPHQIAFHVTHPKNTFILVKSLASSLAYLYEGKNIRELVACGLKLDACCSGLEACCLLLDELGA
jgi:Holliday junction resolvase